MPAIATDNTKSNKWGNLILHIHPKMVPEKALVFNLTFGLGGMSALLFVIQAITGILLRFSYVPTPGKAYDSIIHINTEILFGELIRNIHHWSGMLFVLVAFLHMLRVFFTGAYNENRSSNWIIGVCLLILVVLLNFTGYLLPWDQLSYWAVTVSTNMLTYIPVIGNHLKSLIVQGTEIGAPTLLLFYNVHTGILPLTIVILMGFHFWKTRKAGGVVVPESAELKKVPVIPNLVVREFTVALVLTAFILLLSVFLAAPLSDRANPSITPNPTKAPWYFMGFQELILHFHPIIAVVIIPLLILFSLIYIPRIKNNTPPKGIWFLTPRGKKLALISAIASTIFSILFIVLDEYVLKSIAVFQSGIFSFILLIIAVSAVRWQLGRNKLNRAEIIQTIFIIVLSIFAVFTLTGIFLRGEGMLLIF